MKKLFLYTPCIYLIICIIGGIFFQISYPEGFVLRSDPVRGANISPAFFSGYLVFAVASGFAAAIASVSFLLLKRFESAKAHAISILFIAVSAALVLSTAPQFSHP